jgi:hypothetical protein
MVAVYPSSIKSFAYRQDYTELVEAADVNVSYDEINAIQNTLGTNPQQETIDGTLTKYSNVSSRISAVRRGTNIPYVGVSAHDIQVSFNSDYIPTWNSKLFDTNHMINGQSLTCPRDGIYHFNFYIRWHKDSVQVANLLPTFDRGGKLQLEAFQAGSSAFLTCQTDWFPQGFQDFARQSASMIYPWYKGNAVKVKAYQSCYKAGTLFATVYANIAYIRDIPS